MNLLSVENISKTYGAKVLFKKISFGINYGDKVALVAKNGSGKTTIMNILKGLEIPDEGNVVFKKDIKVGFLEQEPKLRGGNTIIEVLLSAENPVSKALREYEEALNAHMNDPMSEKAADRLDAATNEMTLLNAWDAEVRMKTIAGKLGLNNFEQEVKTLSGGQRKRLALACLLLNEPDLLVLDEPTNHLDIEMIEWLEHHLDTQVKSLLLVTHDRYFLDEICNQIIEIDNKQLYHYKGNYQYYVEKKAERILNEASEIDKAKNLYRRELEWMRKMPKARTTKSKSRINAFYDVEEKAKQRKADQKIDLSVKMSRLGSKILELIKISKSYGDKHILDPFSYTFKNGDKIGLVGKNGSGKTTLLNIILGTEPADSGKIQTGETVIFGYYSQMGMVIPEDKRVIEIVKDYGEFIPLANGTTLSASQLLTRFNFPPDVQFGFASKLSGGEKRRLYLMTILMKNPNFLILDEPTNDLDIETLQTLEDFLVDFGGCVLIVSHDRYFLDKIITQVFAFQGDGTMKDFPGNYTEYRNWQDEQEELKKEEAKPKVQVEEKPVAETKVVSAPAKQTKKLSYKEQKEIEDLEKDIAQLEEDKKQLSEELSSGALDHKELLDKGYKLQQIEDALETKSMRWLELQEKMEA
ncbi:MAG TPA: ATP-binding cassette domain-containing protein [Bacteroidia bacterium]